MKIVYPASTADNAGTIVLRDGLGNITGNVFQGNMYTQGTQYVNVFSTFIANTIVNGILIQTNMPISTNLMATIIVEGYDFDHNNTINMNISFYTYGGVISESACSLSGSYNPGGIEIATSSNGMLQIYWSNLDSNYTFNVKINVPFQSPTLPLSAFEGWTVTDALPTTNIYYCSLIPLATSITGNAATATNAAELVGMTPNNANMPSTIVQRDASGNFSAGTLALTGISTTGNASLNSMDVGSNALTSIGPNLISLLKTYFQGRSYYNKASFSINSTSYVNMFSISLLAYTLSVTISYVIATGGSATFSVYTSCNGVNGATHETTSTVQSLVSDTFTLASGTNDFSISIFGKESASANGTMGDILITFN